MMKKWGRLLFAVALILLMSLSATSCFKSKEATAVDALIFSVGQVTLNSEAAITEAELGYSELTDRQKEEIENFDVLIAARDEYNQLVFEVGIKNVESLINQIGDVSIDSKEKLDIANEAYMLLSKEQQSRVSNYDVLEESKLIYSEKVKLNAAISIYNDICLSSSYVGTILDDLERTWSLFVTTQMDAEKATTEFLSGEISLSQEEVIATINYLVNDEIEEKLRAMTARYNKNIEWEDGYLRFSTDIRAWLVVILQSHLSKGTFSEADKLLDKAKINLKEFSNLYPDYEYYHDLVDFYSEILTNYNLAESPSGNYIQFSGLVLEYKNNIRDYRASLSLVFER